APAFFFDEINRAGIRSAYYLHSSHRIRRVGAMTAQFPLGNGNLGMRLAGARMVAAEPLRQIPNAVHFLRGSDPNGWRTGLTAFEALRYPEVYSGIDLICYATASGSRPSFVVAPGADPAKIQLELSEARSVGVDQSGRLAIETTDGGGMRGATPFAYQLVFG